MVESVSQHIGFASRILRDNDASPEEQVITCRWAAARTSMDAAEKEVETYFMGRLDAALKIHDFDEADALVKRCPPDTVTRVFMLDRIREARKFKTK